MARAPQGGTFTDETLLGPLAKIEQETTQAIQQADAMSGKSGYTFSDTQAQQETGLQGLQQEADTETTGQQSFVAGVHHSVLGSFYDSITMPDFPAQEGFKPDLSTLPGYADGPASEDEARALSAATSPADLAARWDFVKENRIREMQMADNPIAGIAGALLGDAPLMLANIAAGGTATAIGLGRTGVVGFEAGAGALEAAGAAYAWKNNPNVHGTDVVLPALGIAAGGLIGLRRIKTASGADDIVSDTTGILTRQSKDVRGTPDTATVSPVKIVPGEVWAGSIKGQPIKAFTGLDSGMNDAEKAIFSSMKIDDDLTLRISADTTKAARYDAATHTVHISVPHSGTGQSINSIGDALRLLDGPAQQTLRHELVHAATVRRLGTDSTLRDSVEALRKFADVELSGSPKFQRYLTSPEEFVAGLADPEFNRALKGLNVPEELGAKYMQSATGSKSAQQKLFQAFDQHLSTGADKDASIGMRSSIFYDLNSVKANTGEGAASIRQGFIERLGNRLGITKHMSLWDRVAYAGKESEGLANRLFSNGAAAGARSDSAADQLRLIQVESAPDTVAVANAVEQVLLSRGITRTDMVRNSAKYRAQRQQLNDDIVRLMDDNSNAYFTGGEIRAVPQELKGPVEALQNFSKNWRDRMRGSGIAEDIPDNPWYVPRRYEYSNVRQLMRDQGVTRAGIKNLFRQALADAYPAMPTELRTRVAENIEQGIWQNGTSAQMRTWQESLGVDQLQEALGKTGMSPEEITSILEGRVTGSKGAASPRLKGRTQLDTSKGYIVDGKEISLQDLMQKDVIGLVDGYNSSLSGRLALDRVGLSNPRNIQDIIDKAAAEVPANDVENWGAAINDGMNQLMGIGERAPQLMRILQNAASATMLKNSGVYQLVDTTTAVYERGLGNWMKALNKEAWMKEVGDSAVVQRLTDLLEGGTAARDAKFRWLQAQLLDKHEYTKADMVEVWSTNAAQAGMTLNGLRTVTKVQGGINSRVIINTMLDMLEGNAEATKYMQKASGLTDAEIAEMQRLHKANPGAAFEDATLRSRFENAGLRLQDTLTQQNRIGEIPAWATGTAAGRVLVGFMRFALAAHNKIFRRVLNRDGMYGVMRLAVYQAPLMLLAQTLRQARDGQNPFEEETQRRIVQDTAMNLSAFGILPSMFDWAGGQGRASNPALGYAENLSKAIPKIMHGEADLSTVQKAIPLFGLLPAKAAAEAGKVIIEE